MVNSLSGKPPCLPRHAWGKAIICVTSNTERTGLSPILARRFALQEGVPLITWNLQTKSDAASLFPEDVPLPLDSGLVGIFVRAALGYLTENINPALNLANGSPVTLHSLTFAANSAEDDDAMRNALARAKPGEQQLSSWAREIVGPE